MRLYNFHWFNYMLVLYFDDVSYNLSVLVTKQLKWNGYTYIDIKMIRFETIEWITAIM